jgi:enterochelin esterase-like enzyme
MFRFGKRPFGLAILLALIVGLAAFLVGGESANGQGNSSSPAAATQDAVTMSAGVGAIAVVTPDAKSGVLTRTATAGAAATSAASPTLVAPTATPFPTPPPPPAGVSPSRLEYHQCSSTTLGRTMPYFIFLPPGYDSSLGQRYPVLYMLHGLSGAAEEWRWYGIVEDAGALMDTGTIQPYIIVLPQGDQGYWVDQANGGPQWGKYLASDVVGEIDAHFHTLADRDHRALGGLSMGANGALQVAMNYSATFRIAGAHSLSLHTHADAPGYFGDEAYFDAHDPVQLMADHPDIARTLTIWIDIGAQDPYFLQQVENLHQQMLAEGIPLTWHEWPGGHDATYWTAHLPDYLRFYNDAFINIPTGN